VSPEASTSPDWVEVLPFDTVFLMMDLRRFGSGSLPVTTGELPGGGQETARARGCAPVPPSGPSTGAEAGAPAVSFCSAGALTICTTEHHTPMN